jgi:DDE family transposase
MRQHQSVNIRQISRNRAQQVGYYRFLENENVTVAELVRSLAEHCQEQVEGRHVLAVSDSSEINLQSHAGRLKPLDLGVVGNNTDVGFYIHPTLVLDSESGFPLGLSTVQLWSREHSHQDKHERKYQKLPIEKKESYKWLASAERSQRCLSNGGARLVTHIGDRESDLYEEFATVPDQQNHVLVRACQDRRLLDKSQSLYTYLREQPCQGTYTINVPSDQRSGRTAREALLNVRCTTVQIQRPDQLKTQSYPPSITMNAVEAEEVNPPLGQEAIHWRLLTTHSVVCLEQALKVIQWYRWRWRIEQLFATLKKAGLNLEATQLESVTAIQRLTILALGVAVRTLQMVEGRDNSDLPASLTFSVDQQECLSQIADTLEGHTQKQKNPHPRACLPWAVWLIARLGGWSGYSSQRPPGMPTLVHGLRLFESIFLGWKLAHNPLVCTP